MKRTALLLSALLAGCAPTIPIQVSTPEPVKIDVRMQIDVVSKEDASKSKKATSEELEAAGARRSRMAEVQTLKNDRVIGETRQGYLAIKNPPKDVGYAAYTQRVIDAENLDRSKQYDLASRQQGKPFPFIEKEAAERWRNNAFPGEWLQKDDGTWGQK
jgi:uncharacterized protein YdbL (DUF1318 family)